MAPLLKSVRKSMATGAILLGRCFFSEGLELVSAAVAIKPCSYVVTGSEIQHASSRREFMMQGEIGAITLLPQWMAVRYAVKAIREPIGATVDVHLLKRWTDPALEA